MGCHLLLRTEWLRLIIGLHEILTFTRMQELFICIASTLKKKKKVSLHIDLTVQQQSAALTNSKSVDRGLHTLHDTDSTKHIYCIKHQKRVRNSFKTMHCLLSLRPCLGLPLSSACGQGTERSATALAYAGDGCWTPPGFGTCHPGAVQGRGRSRPADVRYFGRARAGWLTDWGKNKKNP